MINWPRFLHLPATKDDEQARLANALQGILIVLGCTLLYILPVLLFLRNYQAIGGLLVGLVVLFISGWLNRRGHTQIASFGFILAVLGVVNYLIVIGQGIHDISVLAYPLILIIGGLLLNRRLYFALSLLILVSANLIILGELRGLIQTTTRVITDYLDMVIVSAILITIGVIVRMLADNLLDSLRKTRQIAMEQANLILETRSQAEQLRIINRVSIAVASELDLERMLVELFHQFKAIVPLDSFYVALVDYRIGLVTFPIFFSVGVRIYIPHEKLDAGSGLTGEVIRSGATLYVPDLADPKTQQEHEIISVGPGDTRSYVGVPLHLHGEVFGVISIQSLQPHAYISEQLRLVEIIASQASVAIDNARLFIEANDVLERERHLNEIAHLISGTVDLHFILENVARLSIQLLGGYAGTLRLVTPDRRQLSEVYDIHLPEIKPVSRPAQGVGIPWAIIESGKSIRLKEYEQDPRTISEMRGLGFHAFVGAPIAAEEVCLGALGVFSTDPLKVYLDRDQALLEAIGRLAGAAIQKARIFSSLQQELAERKRAEKALQESEERFRAIFEKSPTGITLSTLDGQIVAANPSFQDLFGYSLDELQQLRFGQLSYPEDLPAEVENIAKIFSGEIPYFQTEKRYVCKDGHLIWGRMIASMIHDQHGQPQFGLLLVNDISEQKRILEALHQRDAVLELVAFAAETFLKTTHWQDVISHVLQRLGREVGALHTYMYQAEKDINGQLRLTVCFEVVEEGGSADIGYPLFTNSAPDNIRSKYWLEAMLRGDPYFGTLHSLEPEDVTLMLESKVQSYLDVPIQVGNEFWGLIGFEDSLTEREWSEAEIDSLKVAASVLGAAIQREQMDQTLLQLNVELEQRVQERTAELESANRELESFAYSVSHDLRTPLRGIDGYSQLLLEDHSEQLNTEGQGYLENICRATSQMSQLIDDLLKLSRVTRTEMHREEVDLTHLAEAVIQDQFRRDPERQVETIIQPDIFVFGDVNLLHLALENLISNAWKFSARQSPARINIGVENRNGHKVIYVQDNGVGFDMKYHNKLFIAFQRLHSSSEFEGTGIGLATVQRVIQRHSGEIWAEGEIDKGSTFYFSLPDPGPAS